MSVEEEFNRLYDESIANITRWQLLGVQIPVIIGVLLTQAIFLAAQEAQKSGDKEMYYEMFQAAALDTLDEGKHFALFGTPLPGSSLEENEVAN